jgi:hypothetical protein
MSMPIMVSSPLLAASAAFEEGGSATMGGVMAGAQAPVTAILPPGSEDASAAVQAGFAARGVETGAMVAQLAVIRQLFSATMASGAAAYTASDVANEATLIV